MRNAALILLALVACSAPPLAPAALPAFDPAAPRTMKVGYVVAQASYFSPCFVYADLMKQASDWNGQCTLDADGWPTQTQPIGVMSIVTQPPPNGLDQRGLPAAPWGTYTVVWDTPDGAGECLLSTGAPDDAAGPAPPAGQVNRTRAYTFHAPAGTAGPQAPTIAVWAKGNCRNIRIYPPGVATDGSAGLFHPAYLAMLAGSASLRTETMVQVNPSTVVDYGDFPDPRARTFSGLYGSAVVPIASMAPAPAGEDYGFFTPGRGIFVVTTTKEHGLKTGHIVEFRSTAIATLSDGETSPLNFFSPTICVLSPTTFACSIPNPHPVVSVSADPAALLVRRREGSPPEHAVALANAVGATLHLNVPHAISDSGAAALFLMAAKDLDPKLSMRVELSNEPWNTGFPYEQSAYFGYLGRTRGLTQIQAYTQRSAEVQAIARMAWKAAGRPDAQVIGVFNTMAFAGPGSPVDQLLSYARAPTDPKAGGKPIPVDEVAIQAYWNNIYQGTDPKLDALTPDQVMDAAEASLPGTVGAGVATVRKWLDSAGFASTRVIVYEGGPRAMWVGGSTIAALARQSQVGNLHPRANALTLALLREIQDAGCTLFTRQGVVSDLTSDVGVAGGAAYMTYYAWAMPPGIGDGSDGLADNRPILAKMIPGPAAPDYAALVSPLGAAFARWNAPPPPPVTPMPVPVPTTTPAPADPPPTPPPAPPTDDVPTQLQKIRWRLDSLESRLATPFLPVVPAGPAKAAKLAPKAGK